MDSSNFNFDEEATALFIQNGEAIVDSIINNLSASELTDFTEQMAQDTAHYMESQSSSEDSSTDASMDFVSSTFAALDAEYVDPLTGGINRVEFSPPDVTINRAPAISPALSVSSSSSIMSGLSSSSSDPLLSNASDQYILPNSYNTTTPSPTASSPEYQQYSPYNANLNRNSYNGQNVMFVSDNGGQIYSVQPDYLQNTVFNNNNNPYFSSVVQTYQSTPNYNNFSMNHSYTMVPPSAVTQAYPTASAQSYHLSEYQSQSASAQAYVALPSMSNHQFSGNSQTYPVASAHIDPMQSTPAQISPISSTPAQISPISSTPAPIDPGPSTSAPVEPVPSTPAPTRGKPKRKPPAKSRANHSEHPRAIIVETKAKGRGKGKEKKIVIIVPGGTPSNPTARRFDCSYCPKDYAHHPSLFRHIKQAHAEERVPKKRGKKPGSGKKNAIPPGCTVIQEINLGASTSRGRLSAQIQAQAPSTQEIPVLQLECCTTCCYFFDSPLSRVIHRLHFHPELINGSDSDILPGLNNVGYTCPICKEYVRYCDVKNHLVAIHGLSPTLGNGSRPFYTPSPPQQTQDVNPEIVVQNANVQLLSPPESDESSDASQDGHKYQ